MKKLLTVLLALLVCFGALVACNDKTPAADNTPNSDVTPGDTTPNADPDVEPDETPVAKTTLTVGFDKDFPPYGFEENGEYTGFDLDMAKEAATRLGLEIVYQPINWDAKDFELESGNIDCIWNGFTMNGREELYAWTDAYMNNSQVFVVRANEGIATSADLAGKVVTVQRDSSAQAALEDLTELSATFASLETCEEYNTAFMELESGVVDAIAMDVGVAQFQIKGRENFIILDEALASEQYGVGFYKENIELRDKVQAVLEEMVADGTFAAISEKWFGVDVGIIGK